ncbi:MAG: Holliday junction resolvase RuvX [Peptoniphilaceae bacterium]|nr:Holliday junction resolvase RuvX [Peptoniphilaceae bacterium]MDY6085604.1 Holliday junction resolvase RuvX [Peptoniphilaceae bacterium]
MTRAMGLDVGSKTIGVALSDPTYLIAQAKETIRHSTQERDVDQLEAIIRDYDVTEVVIGLPRHMNNALSDSARRAQSYGAALVRRGVRVFYQDERLTTRQATEVLKQTGVRRENRKAHVDAIAATFILQAWLDRNGRKHEQ